jgi:catechol 2,3-dioxygenase-like lactoylglutathione lyase family enzyme
MSTTEWRTVGRDAKVDQVDLKLEAIVVPVADVARSKAFYTCLGWRLDSDRSRDDGFRVVQFTPPGSPTSIQFGTGVTAAEPGSAHGIYLVVSDIVAAHEELVSLGVEVSEVFHVLSPGAQLETGAGGRVAGPAEGRTSYGSFATFRDPDGNSYVLQEVTSRLPGRVESTVTTFISVNDLMQALIRAAAAHCEHEQRPGRNGAAWPAWYAAYMVAERSGGELPR